MSKITHLLAGSGRINRRQYLVMIIVTVLFIFILEYPLEMIVVAILGAQKSILLLFLITTFFELIIGLPMGLAYTIRRGHDFGVKTLISSIYVIAAVLLYIFSGVYELLGNFGAILEIFMTIAALIYLFFPGSKVENQYGAVPFNSGKPKTIFRYMLTGNWNT